MDLTEIISLDPNYLNDETKEELYNALAGIQNIDIIPKKNVRKILSVCLAIMKHKGDQVNSLQEQLETKTEPDSADDSHNKRIQEENEKLKRMINKLEEDKSAVKSKVKEMNEEIIHLQKRLSEAMQSAESDKDSSDPLSELDRQEELLKNIDCKNKHIKRLLREIEFLQTSNIEQTKTIIELEQEHSRAKSKLNELSEKTLILEEENKAFKEKVNELNAEVTRLEGNITYLEDEREKSENDLKRLIEKLETKAKSWRSAIDEKNNEIKKLKTKLYSLPENSLQNEAIDEKESEIDDKKEIEEESTRMMHAIEIRDKIIEDLESKVKTMAKEMISSTRIMNKISSEREDERISGAKKSRQCCKSIEESLTATNQRCQELSYLLEKSEEDNLVKSKQAAHAIAALDAYQRGEDGLPKALKRIMSLEEKLNVREKQIRELVTELNSMHEISSENALLRKKLNIADDVVILAKNRVAKERSKDKQIERLTLKLRSSEEMRLQLKLEKSDLRKQLLQLQNESKLPNSFIDNCHENGFDSFSKNTKPEMYCDKCLNNIKQLPTNEHVVQDVIQEWKTKYDDVLEENEHLRAGMHEILEKIREYDASSEYITIDCEILERLLYAFDTRKVSNHPVMRIQNELVVLKERELALREKINASKIEDNSLQTESVNVAREVGELLESPVPSVPEIPLESATRPTTPNNTLDQSLYPVIIEVDSETESLKKECLKILEKNRSLQQDVDRLQVFQIHFEELQSQMKASDSQVTKYCSEIVHKLSDIEIQFKHKNRAYDFLKEDFDRTLRESKSLEIKNMSLIAELKKQINDQTFYINRLKSENESLLKQTCNSDEYTEMQMSLYNLQSQVAIFIDQVFSGKVSDIKIDEICTDYGIIQENLQLDFITIQEYEDIQKEKSELLNTKTDLQIKCEHLESLLVIAKEQVTSQQDLLREITDNHIDLRHLVADLQSSSEDKFLIAKLQRELNYATKEISHLKLDKENYEQKEEKFKEKIGEMEKEIENIDQSFQNQIKNTEIKTRFLKKSLQNLRQKYFKFTPLIFLSNFIYSYSKFSKNSKLEEKNLQESLSKKIDEALSSKLMTATDKGNDSQDRIKLIKTVVKAKYLEEQVQVMSQKNNALQVELDELRLLTAKESEHWKTIEALFAEDAKHTLINQSTQTEMNELVDSVTNTEEKLETQTENYAVSKADKNLSPIATPEKKLSDKTSSETQTSSIVTSNKLTSPIRAINKPSESPEKPVLKTQEIQTSPKHSEVTKDSQGVQTSPKLQPSPEKQKEFVDEDLKKDEQEAHTSPIVSPKHQPSTDEEFKIKELEQQLKESIALSEERKTMLENTEASLQETQKSMELIKKEMEEQKEELKKLKENDIGEKSDGSGEIIEKTILSFHTLLSEKDKSINKYQELLTSERNENDAISAKYQKDIESLTITTNNLKESIKVKDEEILDLKVKLEATQGAHKEKLETASGLDDNVDNSLQEISDEKIEEMFNDEGISDSTHKKQLESSKGITEEIKSKEKHWENILRIKEEEIILLKEKLNVYNEREKIDTAINPEIEQLRILLDEKDKHINDLMDTLTNFHDDQQRFFNDSSTYSADQISKLAADLTRSEATNKIYQTQLEALRRQLANLNQREKQARDLNNSLRNQLIKRPVVSIKTELNARLRTENLQKKVAQLETELEEYQLQIKRQQVIIDAKRAKTNNEVGLWEKQKRWQQSAEKYKAKFEETEAALEKHKALLHSARTSISRLEKDKQILESRVGKAFNTMKCCRTPSCPNLQGTKYTPSETPETCTGDSECSSPIRGLHFLGSNHTELIEALKARIELQQRKIIAMEMEGRGSNALTTELEKLQEKYSAIEAQNIRLEARNLQLQLDNDLLRQGDSGERMQKRLKHLEDYIIALKEELAQAEARRDLNFEPKQERKYAPGQADQTILSLRSIIEKLRAENKYLKDATRTCDTKNKEQSAPAELLRLQHMYTESLDKISALKIELQLKTRCQNCGNQGHLETSTSDEVRLIKDQLFKKTQLLEKAKILLTRAAAKEKVLKEQLALWKRKCSELQNVPVIDEISE